MRGFLIPVYSSQHFLCIKTLNWKVHYGLCSIGDIEILCQVHVKYTYLCIPQFSPPVHFSHLTLKTQEPYTWSSFGGKETNLFKISMLLRAGTVTSLEGKQTCFSLCNSLVIWSQRWAQGTSEILKQELLLPTCRLLHLCNVKWVWLENTADIQRQQALVVTGAGWGLGTVSRQAGVQLWLRKAGVRSCGGCAVPLGTAIYMEGRCVKSLLLWNRTHSTCPSFVFWGERGQCLGSGERSLPSTVTGSISLIIN